MEELTLEGITRALKSITSGEDLQPYKDLGDGLYELPGNIMTNKKGLELYLETLQNEIKKKTCNYGLQKEISISKRSI